MYQFWFLQLILLIGAFSKGKGRNKGKGIANYSPSVKAVLFMVEGLLLMAIAWIWKEEPGSVSLLYLIGGAVWLMVGCISYLYSRVKKRRPIIE